MIFTSRYIFRYLHSTVPRTARNRRGNPFASAEKINFKNDEAIAEDPEGFGDIESDFMSVHKTHRQHEQEIHKRRDQVRQFMIKHKYFRDVKLPNLLTFAEKEQIRLLHSRDPDEWTVERLTESFPATMEIVEKILNSNWRPSSAERVRKHDEAVIKNWEELRSGKSASQLPQELREHLQKFTIRRKEDLQTPEEKWLRPPLPKPKVQEFSSIITSLKKNQQNASQNHADTNSDVLLLKPGKIDSKPAQGTLDEEQESYLLDKVKDRRRMRMQELKKLKLTASDLGNKSPETPNNTDTLEQRAIMAFGNSSGTGIISSSTTIPTHLDFTEKFQSNEIVISPEDQKRFEMTSVKDRIHIPRKVYHKGATYRVRDCYYDDDGELLYRVPGMTGNND